MPINETIQRYQNRHNRFFKSKRLSNDAEDQRKILEWAENFVPSVVRRAHVRAIQEASEHLVGLGMALEKATKTSSIAPILLKIKAIKDKLALAADYFDKNGEVSVEPEQLLAYAEEELGLKLEFDDHIGNSEQALED